MTRAGEAHAGLVVLVDGARRTVARVLHGHVGVTLTFRDGGSAHYGERYQLQVVGGVAACADGLNWCGGGCDACEQRRSDTPESMPQIGEIAYSARMTNHHEAALAHIENVTTAREQIRDVYANPTAPGASARLAILNAQCGDSLKLAEVHATLAVAQAVEQIGLSL